MPRQTWEMRQATIALAIWAEDTGNGTGLDREMQEEHRQVCFDAAANAYLPGMTDAVWLKATYDRLHRLTA